MILKYRNYMLGVLLLVGVVGSFERFVFSLVLEPIKNDLQLTDGQLGLMTGIAFTAFYALAGIPIARWADRGNRVTITALVIGLSGLMVSLCGVASSFIQLLAVRAGVAVGEAGVVPAGQSLISEYFDRSERPNAMAIFFSGYGFSMILGYMLGGWLVESYGWRHTFLVIGLPGILMALVVKLTLKEPRVTQEVNKKLLAPSFVNTYKALWSKPSFRQIFYAFCVSYFFTMGIAQWLPTFFIRSHGMTPIEVGAWLAFSFGVCAVFGNYLGGHYANRYAKCKEALQMRALAFAIGGYGLISLLVYLVSDKYIALLLMGLSSIFLTFGNGPVFAAIHSLVEEKMRSTAVALIFLFANLIGFGLGPLILGVVSDLLHPAFGYESLRYALVLFCPGTLWVAVHYWRAGNTIEKDIGTVQSQEVLDLNNLDSKVTN